MEKTKKSLYIALYEDDTENISNFMTFIYEAGNDKLQKVFAKLYAKEYGLKISDAPEAYIYEIKTALDMSGKNYKIIPKI